jgi:hypothetical protein
MGQTHKHVSRTIRFLSDEPSTLAEQGILHLFDAFQGVKLQGCEFDYGTVWNV